MLTFPSALKIYLAVEPVDMRKAFNGLWTVAEQKLREDPRQGAVFVNKDRNRLKMLYWDGTGVWIFAQREAFADLPVEEAVEIVPEPVKAAPELYEKIGEEETFEIDVVPPKLFKRRIVRPKYRHRLDRTRPPVMAPAPARPVPGGYASAGLLAWITLCKYLEHQPRYRQEQMSARWGARIPRQTMVEWIALVAAWLLPIYHGMRRELVGGGYVQCDETPIRCNDPDVRGQTVQGWLWVLSRPGGNIVFEWRMSRRQTEATTLLAGFRGVLQSDAYPAYAHFAREHEGVVCVGCWAHARRRFHAALEDAPVQAGFVLRLIGHLYALEAKWDEAQWTAPALRAHLRCRDFACTLSLLKNRCQALGPRFAEDTSRRSLQLSARAVGAADGASPLRPDTTRHQLGGECDPPYETRCEKLALYRSSRRR